MPKIVALVALLLVVLGLAHHIEITARPPTNRTGEHRSGEEHAH